MHPLPTAVQRQLDSWEEDLGRPLWRRDQVLVVGVSGGPDSLALLHLLVKQGLHPAEKVVVGHLDHHLRPSSTEESRWVARLCERWGLRYRIGEAIVSKLAQREGLTIEEAARVARYRFLGQLALESDSQRVVVGHTADDQAETVLMHVIRGAGLTGLRGMMPVTRLHGFAGIELLRPLLTIGRDVVEAYCRAHSLEPLYDPSNEELTFFRNRLRHELLPLLEAYNPQIRERLIRTAEVVRADVELLEEMTDEALGRIVAGEDDGSVRLHLDRWRALPLSLRRRTLRRALWRFRRSIRDVSFGPLEQARKVAEVGPVGAKSGLPGGLVLEVEYDTLWLHEPDQIPGPSVPQLGSGSTLDLPTPGSARLEGGWKLQAVVSTLPESLEVTERFDSWTEFIDADRAGELIVRTRRAGERMEPLGMGGRSAKVADVMINEKIPERARAGWPLVANADHVVWLVGIRLDHRARVTDHTRRVIQLRCTRDGS